MPNPFIDRCAKPKPERGEFRAERLKKSAEARTNERDEKAKCRKRDGAACKGYCRIPGCKTCTYLEVAHCIEHKKMGGDKLTIRSTVDKLIQTCQSHHRGGNGSIDSGDMDVRPLTSAGTDGPCEFLRVVESFNEHGALVRTMVVFAYETSIGVFRYV